MLYCDVVGVVGVGFGGFLVVFGLADEGWGIWGLLLDYIWSVSRHIFQHLALSHKSLQYRRLQSLILWPINQNPRLIINQFMWRIFWIIFYQLITIHVNISTRMNLWIMWYAGIFMWACESVGWFLYFFILFEMLVWYWVWVDVCEEICVGLWWGWYGGCWDIYFLFLCTRSSMCLTNYPDLRIPTNRHKKHRKIFLLSNHKLMTHQIRQQIFHIILLNLVLTISDYIVIECIENSCFISST